jgi:hypothetical protein
MASRYITRQDVEDLRMPMDKASALYDPRGLVDPLSLQALSWHQLYDVDKRKQDIEDARNR